MTRLAINEHLTDTPREHKITHAGMAFFAGTGPLGKTCGKCRFWARGTETAKNASCGKWRELMHTSKAGPKVPSEASACRYWEGRPGG